MRPRAMRQTHPHFFIIVAVLTCLAVAPLRPLLAAVPPSQQTSPGAEQNDHFTATSLGEQWSLDDPNGNDTLSLTARPGWLRVQVRGSDEDMWQDTRGGAPILKQTRPYQGDFSVATCVDLATPNNGYPVVNSIGGLVVCDPRQQPDTSPFLLTLGLQHNWDAGTQVILQKPGHSFKWASPGSNAVQLRLDREATSRSWAAYYRVHIDAAWSLLTRVTDAELSSPSSDAWQVGLFAKTWDSRVGGPAGIDFAYFGEPDKTDGELASIACRFTAGDRADRYRTTQTVLR